LVEKYEDLAFQEKEQKEALIRQVCFVTRISDDKRWFVFVFGISLNSMKL